MKPIEWVLYALAIGAVIFTSTMIITMVIKQ